MEREVRKTVLKPVFDLEARDRLEVAISGQQCEAVLPRSGRDQEVELRQSGADDSEFLNQFGVHDRRCFVRGPDSKKFQCNP